MIKVLFFAQLREQLNSQGLELTLATPCDINAIKHALIEHNSQWHAHLSQDTILCAVNQTMVDNRHLVQDGDEVAFFPPVTGG
jgi:molybdopterin synthase sulfur carrier subunit